MSMSYWGVVMRGVCDNDLSFNEEKVDGMVGLWETENNSEMVKTVKLPNGKEVLLTFELTEDKTFLGFEAGYPWEKRNDGIAEEDVDNAIVQYLLPYVFNTEAQIKDSIEYINTVNYG